MKAGSLISINIVFEFMPLRMIIYQVKGRIPYDDKC
jgi:hypothetical protein